MVSEFNVDWSALQRRKLENGDLIAMGSDAEYHAEFHMAKVPNFDGTDFAEVPHLKLQAPGNTKTVYDQPVRMDSYPGRPSDPERFPREWAGFQAGQSSEVGTSIYDWPDLTPSDARRFELNGIHTVEQLARVSDVNLAGLGMGAMALRERARTYLSGNTAESELRAEIGKLQDVVQMLLEERETKTGRKTKESIDG